MISDDVIVFGQTKVQTKESHDKALDYKQFSKDLPTLDWL